MRSHGDLYQSAPRFEWEGFPFLHNSYLGVFTHRDHFWQQSQLHRRLYFTVLRSSRRISDSGKNFTLRLSAVICVLPVRGILRILPCLWRTSNLPKRGSFRVKPSVLMFSVISPMIASRAATTILFASRSERRLRAARTRGAMVSRPTCA